MAEQTETPLSNVNSDLWAEAAAFHQKDLADVLACEARIKQERLRLKAAKKKLKNRQDHFAALGVPALAIEKSAFEREMSEDERHTLYATETIRRRALGLLPATADFKRLMRRADATATADREAIEKIDGQRAYNDGFNSAAHGGSGLIDNPHMQGTLKHVEWHRGCVAGMELRAAFESPVLAEAQGSAPTQPEEMPEPETIAKEVKAELAEQASQEPPQADGWPVEAKAPVASANDPWLAESKAKRGKSGQFQKKEAAPEPQSEPVAEPEPDAENPVNLFDAPIEMPGLPH